MEVKGATFLYTLATLMITFAGFSALLLAVRPAAGAKLSRKVVGDGPPPAIFAVFVVLGSATTVAMLCYVLEGLPYSAAAYITALTIDFFTVIFGFLVALNVIMQQPMEAAVRPAPRGDSRAGCDG